MASHTAFGGRHPGAGLLPSFDGLPDSAIVFRNQLPGSPRFGVEKKSGLGRQTGDKDLEMGFDRIDGLGMGQNPHLFPDQVPRLR